MMITFSNTDSSIRLSSVRPGLIEPPLKYPPKANSANSQRRSAWILLKISRAYALYSCKISTLLLFSPLMRSILANNVFVEFLNICCWSQRNFLAKGGPMSRRRRLLSRGEAVETMLSTFIPILVSRQYSGSLFQGSLLSFSPPQA